MIRKAIIVMLTLATVATFTLWIQSHLAGRRFDEYLLLVRYCTPGRERDEKCKAFAWAKPVESAGWIVTFKASERVILCALATDGLLRLCYFSGTQPFYIQYRQRRFTFFASDDGSRIAILRTPPPAFFQANRIRNPIAIWRGNPVQWSVIRAPLWWVSVLLATYPTIAFIRGPLRRHRRRRRGECIGCGYDLTGNESGVCPECGEAI